VQALLERLKQSKFGGFILFASNGAITAATYSAVVWTLIALSGQTFALDVLAAYACAVAANYTGSRLIFGADSSVRSHVPRYATVVCLNFAITAGIAALLHGLGAPTAFAAYLPVIITAIPSYYLMRSWVFAPSPPKSAGRHAVSRLN
jgi:putative flippase GtrA